MAQGQNNHMFFSTRKGVISFNGDQWNFIPSGNLPYALEYDSASDRLYVGCLNMLGYLEKDEFGKFNFKELYTPKDEIGVIYDIILDSNNADITDNQAGTYRPVQAISLTSSFYQIIVLPEYNQNRLLNNPSLLLS